MPTPRAKAAQRADKPPCLRHRCKTMTGHVARTIPATLSTEPLARRCSGRDRPSTPRWLPMRVSAYRRVSMFVWTPGLPAARPPMRLFPGGEFSARKGRVR